MVGHAKTWESRRALAFVGASSACFTVDDSEQ
jgi:hypothetical protein